MTRCDADGRDHWESKDDQVFQFHSAMFPISENIVKRAFETLDARATWWARGFDDSGSIEMVPTEIIIRAFHQIDPRSSPGFPFERCSQNSDVNLSELCQHVQHAWGILMDEGFDGLFSFDPEEPNTDDYVSKVKELYERGLVYPASVFVKGEPTSKAKEARLIYGNSLVLNVVSHILFGDVVNQLPCTQEEGFHSIGLDFLSPAGVEAFAHKMTVNIDPGSYVVSDDVQGWEYMVRFFMWLAFCLSFIGMVMKHLPESQPRRSKLISLYRNWAKFTATRLVVLSDGRLVVLPRFTTLSGIFETHYFNSEARSTLAQLDADYAERMLSVVRKKRTTDSNGDDNVTPFPVYVDPKEWGLFSKSLGFKHTDVLVDRWVPGGRIEFCSQDIVLQSVDELGNYHITMTPHGVTKSTYNLCDAVLHKDFNALVDLITHFSRAGLGGAALAYAKAQWPLCHGEELDLYMA